MKFLLFATMLILLAIPVLADCSLLPAKETVRVTQSGRTYDVTADFVSHGSASLIVNGEHSGLIDVGRQITLEDGSVLALGQADGSSVQFCIASPPSACAMPFSIEEGASQSFSNLEVFASHIGPRTVRFVVDDELLPEIPIYGEATTSAGVRLRLADIVPGSPNVARFCLTTDTGITGQVVASVDGGSGPVILVAAFVGIAICGAALAYSFRRH